MINLRLLLLNDWESGPHTRNFLAENLGDTHRLPGAAVGAAKAPLLREGTAPPRRGGAPRDHGAPGALTRLAVQRVAQQGQSGGPFGEPGSAPSPGCSCSADRGQRKQFQL